MSNTMRFNLDFMRGLSKRSPRSGPIVSNDLHGVSRRSFLALFGSTAALRSVPALAFGTPFSVVREGARAHVMVGGEPRWTIDPAVFGDDATLTVSHSANGHQIDLCDGSFPGTSLSADFRCRLETRESVWWLSLRFANGIEVEAELLRWLVSRTSAVGTWDTSKLTPCNGVALSFAKPPVVELDRHWTVTVAGRTTVQVKGLRASLDAPGCRIVFDHPEQIAGDGAAGHRTTFLVERGKASWLVDVSKRSNQGWALDHDPSDEIFDELRIETADSAAASIRTALLLQNPENQASIKLYTGGDMVSDDGDPYHLPLERTRLAFSLDEEGHQTSLIANLANKDTWAHGVDASYLVRAAADSPSVEIHQDGADAGTPQVSPAICEVCFPNDSACLSVVFGVPRPVPFTWADLAAPFEHLAAWLHLMPSQHGNKLVIDLQRGDYLSVERPYDLLSLRLKFDKMRLITGIAPRIVHVNAHDVGSVSVVFPPQHAAEEAFYHANDSTNPGGLKQQPVPIGNVELKDYWKPAAPQSSLQQLQALYDPDVGVSPEDRDKVQPGIRFSKESNLAFHFPKSDFEISCTIEALLDWSRWIPS